MPCEADAQADQQHSSFGKFVFRHWKGTDLTRVPNAQPSGGGPETNRCTRLAIFEQSLFCGVSYNPPKNENYYSVEIAENRKNTATRVQTSRHGIRMLTLHNMAHRNQAFNLPP